MVRGIDVPLDTSRFVSLGVGYRIVADARHVMMVVAHDTRPPSDGPMLLRHLELGTLVAAAAAFHEGAVREAAAGNAHATYTLIRSQVELFAVANYALAVPDYLEVLMTRPETDGLGGSSGRRRKSMQSLIDRAVQDGHQGIGRLYAWLSDLAHFGTGAMSLPLEGGAETEDAIALRIDIRPHWRDDNHQLAALASIEEQTLGIATKVAAYHERHIEPLLEDLDRAQALDQIIGWSRSPT